MRVLFILGKRDITISTRTLGYYVPDVVENFSASWVTPILFDNGLPAESYEKFEELLNFMLSLSTTLVGLQVNDCGPLTV